MVNLALLLFVCMLYACRYLYVFSSNKLLQEPCSLFPTDIAPTSTCTANYWPKSWMTLSWTPSLRLCLKSCVLSSYQRSILTTTWDWRGWELLPVDHHEAEDTREWDPQSLENTHTATAIAMAPMMTTWCWTWALPLAYSQVAVCNPHRSLMRAAMMASCWMTWRVLVTLRTATLVLGLRD